MISNPEFLSVVVEWRERNVAALAADGVEVRLIGPTSTRNKDSVTAEIVAPDRLVGVTIWDSGESEVIVALTDRGRDPVVVVNELDDPQVISQLLARAVVGSWP